VRTFHSLIIPASARLDSSRRMGIMLGVLGDFFRNYGTPFATAVAIVNTVITVIISYFFQSSKRAKYVLVAASVFFGVIAIAATFILSM
jgi:intracellular septation protein A